MQARSSTRAGYSSKIEVVKKRSSERNEKRESPKKAKVEDKLMNSATSASSASAGKFRIDSFVTLNNGVKMPLFGLGTFRLKGENKAPAAIAHALKMGYRHIDTASIYRNEELVANGIDKSKVPREEIFITSKLKPEDHGYDKAIKACNESLEKLRTTYLDLYLIHWPGKKGLKTDSKMNAVHRKESWRALETLYKEGKCKAIGVSNYTKVHLEELLEDCTVIPHVNQVEYHPYLTQTDLLSFCREKGIQLEAYSSLGQGELVANEDVARIAIKYGKSVPQVLLRWGLQQEIPVIPKSSDHIRIDENAQIFDFDLGEKDMESLAALNKDKHFAWDPTTVT